MVLFERAMIELSSLTASVTLRWLADDVQIAPWRTYIREFGFFFFLRMAVAVSSFCGGSARAVAEGCLVVPTSFGSAPSGFLRFCQSRSQTDVWWRATYFERSTLGLEWSGSADILLMCLYVFLRNYFSGARRDISNCSAVEGVESGVGG
jgi:hypothetical protein